MSTTQAEPMATRAEPQGVKGSRASDPLAGGELSDPLQCDTGGGGVVTETAAEGAGGPGGRLPHFSQLQASFGRHDLSGAKAHTGPAADRATGDLAAHGYTTGSDVVLGKGADLHTVAHEAAHYVQQQQGLQLYGGLGEPGDPWERHADAVADAVVSGQSAEPVLDAMPGGAAGGVQLKGTGEASTNEQLILKLIQQIVSQTPEPGENLGKELDQQARERSAEDPTLDAAVAWLEQQRDQGRLKNIGGIDSRMETLVRLYDQQRELKVRLGEVPEKEVVLGWRAEALELSADEPTLAKSEEALQRRIDEAQPRTEGLVALDKALDGWGKLQPSFEPVARNEKATLAVEDASGDLLAAARAIEEQTALREKELRKPVEDLGGQIKGELGKQRSTGVGGMLKLRGDEAVDTEVNDAWKLSPDLRDTSGAQGSLQGSLKTETDKTSDMQRIDKILDELQPLVNGQQKWRGNKLRTASSKGNLGDAADELQRELDQEIARRKKPVLDQIAKLTEESKKQLRIPWLARPALTEEDVKRIEVEAFKLSPSLTDVTEARKYAAERAQRENAETNWLSDISGAVEEMSRLHEAPDEEQKRLWATGALSTANGDLKAAVGVIRKQVEERKAELLSPLEDDLSKIGAEHEKQRLLTTKSKAVPDSKDLNSKRQQAVKKLNNNYLDLTPGRELLAQQLEQAQRDTASMTLISDRIEAFAELSAEFGEKERQALLKESRGGGQRQKQRSEGEMAEWLSSEKERRKRMIVEPLDQKATEIVLERKGQEKYNEVAGVLGERPSVENLVEQALGSGGLKNHLEATKTLARQLAEEKKATQDLEALDKAVKALVAMHEPGDTNNIATWLQKASEAGKSGPTGVLKWLTEQGTLRSDELTKGLDAIIKQIEEQQTQQKKAKKKPSGGIRAIDPVALKETAIAKAPSLLDLAEAEKHLKGELEKQKTLTNTLFSGERKTVAAQTLNPSLKLNFTVTITGSKLLKWFDEVTRAELPDLYDETEPTKNKNKVTATLTKDNWISTFSQLHRKDVWQENDPGHRPNKGMGESFTNIGSLDVGGDNYNVEEKMWVKPDGQGKATRYNDLGSHLATGKSASDRAKGIRAVVQGKYGEADDHEKEAALAMLGAETARNPRSYGVGLMLLDSVEQGQKYGKNSNKDYAWDGILGSKPHVGENSTGFYNRKTKGTTDKVNRWNNMSAKRKTASPPTFHTPTEEWDHRGKKPKFPFAAYWAGKWSMSPSASMSLGARTTAIDPDGNKLNTVQYKEVKTILRWLELVLPGIQLEVTNETQAEAMLKRIFKLRLANPDKLEAKDIMEDLDKMKEEEAKKLALII